MKFTFEFYTIWQFEVTYLKKTYGCYWQNYIIGSIFFFCYPICETLQILW